MPTLKQLFQPELLPRFATLISKFRDSKVNLHLHVSIRTKEPLKILIYLGQWTCIIVKNLCTNVVKSFINRVSK